jgi:peptidoglycan/LPS O-acetylase OafA/YrhL
MLHSDSAHPSYQKNDKISGESVNLDFLRSCAVLFVVFFHLLLVHQTTPWTLAWIGHWGVLIFFVHTSLVLMYSLKRHRRVSFSESYRDFLIRRCFRIYPLSIATVLIIYLLEIPVGHLLVGDFVSVSIDAKVLTSNLLLLQNVTGSESVMATLWSLPYEMQMYFVLPILFFIANSKSGLYRLLGCFALAALVGAMLPNAQWHGWEMPRYVPCFLAGVISYRFSLDQRPILPGWTWPLFIAALTLVYLARPGIKAGWVCCLLLAFGIPCFAELRHGRLVRWCHVIAKYSYGIYLMHFICLWISFEVFAAAPEWFRLISFFLLVAITSVAVYHAIELPLIKFSKRFTAPRLTRPTAGLASVQSD